MLSIGSLFTYWLLKILLVSVLIFCGYGISYKQPRKFKIYAITAAIFYSLIQGLRWDRGADYMHYYHDLVGRWDTPNPEFLYKIIVNFLSIFLGLPYWCGFITYSLMLISAILLIYKIYPKAAVWGLPLFFLITASSSENIVRQYLAISFVIFAYYAYLKKKNILAVVFLCCVPMIHISGLMSVIIFVLLALFKIPLKRPWILLGIFVTLYFFWEISYFSSITDNLSTLNLGGDIKMQSYLDNSNRWFTDEGSISNVLYGKSDVTSLTNSLFNFILNIIIIYYGFKAQLMDHRLQIAYYFSYIAIIFNVIGGDIEMYHRFYNWYIYLMPLILGVAMYKVPMRKYERYTLFTILIINYYIYGLLWNIFNIPYHGFAFIWDR
jgi:hypothetical protein